MTTYCDNTILTSVNTCDLKAALRHVLHLTSGDERLELAAGTAVHEALAGWHRGEGTTNALIHFDALYKPVGSKVSIEDRLSFTNVRRTLTRFFTYYTQYPIPYQVQPDLVEVTFEAPLDENGDYVIIGRIDQIETYQGRLVVGENKTTGSLSGWWKDKWPLSSQLTTYVYGAQYGLVDGKPLGLPIEEALVLGLELRKLPNSNTKCREHALPYAECGDLHAKWEFSGPHPRPAGLVQRWKADALKAAQRFAWMKANIDSVQTAANTLEQQGQFNGSCVFCEYKDYCRQGVPAELMEANLVKDEWDPRHVTHTPTLIMPTSASTQPQGSTTKPEGSRGVLVGAAPIPSNARKV